jgi:hypothetical protein
MEFSAVHAPSKVKFTQFDYSKIRHIYTHLNSAMKSYKHIQNIPSLLLTWLSRPIMRFDIWGDSSDQSPFH